MDPRRLRLLVELSRRGSMRAVADATGHATSAVSQQLGVLEREAGTALLERVGRGVRLTPAGQRLVEHAEGILAALETARADLAADAEPSGLVRVAAFASALSGSLLPLVRDLRATNPRLRVELQEREPDEALRLLADDAIDLALVYDYNLAPRTPDPATTLQFLWRTEWCLAVSDGDTPDVAAGTRAGSSLAVERGAAIGLLRDTPWIVNSRGSDDENVVRTLCAVAGYVPHVGHRADSLDLVEEMIAAGLGVALLPRRRPRRHGVRLAPLDPPVISRAYAMARRGRASWPPVRLLVDRLAPEAG